MRTVKNKICKIGGCDGKHSGLGYCHKHYIRFKRYGDPLKTLRKEYAPSLPRKMPFNLRFWSRVAVTANPDRCWEWMGYRNNDGYGAGILFEGQSNEKAHRIAWYLTHGEMPSLSVLHECDNRACCNPKHLHLGTQDDNMKEAAERNRMPQGTRHHWSKLTEVDIPVIRAMRADGVTYKAIGETFGVTGCTVSAIIKGETWNHVS